jgi:hypothetical protein
MGGDIVGVQWLGEGQRKKEKKGGLNSDTQTHEQASASITRWDQWIEEYASPPFALYDEH